MLALTYTHRSGCSHLWLSLWLGVFSLRLIQVGKLFLMIDEDGSGECSREEFINGVAGNPKIYDAFREMNPYTQFFTNWKKNDETLQNLLTAAYYSADPREHHASIRDRVSELRQNPFSRLC